MPSERIQRRIDALLDEAEGSITARDWAAVAEKARAVLAITPENEDAASFLKMAEANGGASAPPRSAESQETATAAAALPAHFAAGRYAVRRFLGDGGRKRVYLAHDARLGRDVALCAIRTEGLDAIGLERVRREAQAMGSLGSHPNLVAVYDTGDDAGTQYIVEEYMGGGDVAALVEGSPDHCPPLERTLAIALDICRGLAFIHARNLLHRDLKPANVFLATDGAAKIGDFGLAVALGRSRLTQHGLMLGTVAYMPPEHALGGESTPRSDLYSLGAMLYEMVTGRPPFVGDDPTSVISQHINTPPVAPSWVTEHCPPSLEALILQLLEKDPEKRPASAEAVLEALDTVDPTERSATHTDSNALERLARGVFVGREKELERLRKAFDEAFAGHGGLVMLVGEPGIGKTRTTHELETYARMRGATVLWGRTHESAGAPACWPWIQVGNQWVASAGAAAGQLAISSDALSELSRLFPFLRQQPNFIEPRPEDDAAVAQFRLLDAYAAFLHAVAAQAPLMVALDDLHWADKSTLSLLQHLARELSRSRILVVGNYRDTDITRQSALSETLAGLNREGGFERIVLRGLTRPEVHSYISAKAHTEPNERVVERIFEETEGNPFFLSEVVNLMAEEGTLARDSVSDVAIPDGVREAIGRRLNRLAKDTNAMLQIAAIIGRDVSYDALAATCAQGDERQLKSIEEALDARVIEELDRPGRYRFTHAQMQETLLAELSTTRRVRLHGQVGEALEALYGPRAEQRAAELARHFTEAATLSHGFGTKAVHYAVLAAQDAERQLAPAEAVHWYEAALAAAEEPDPAILVALAYSYTDAFSMFDERPWPALIRALDIYRARGDHDAFARAVAGMPLAVIVPWQTLHDTLVEAISYATAITNDVSVELRLRGTLFGIVLNNPEGRDSSEETRVETELAEIVSANRHIPEARAVGHLLEAIGMERDMRFLDAARAHRDASLAYADAGLMRSSVTWAMSAANGALLGGDLDQADEYLFALKEVSTRRRDGTGLFFVRALSDAMALLRWDEAGIRDLVSNPGIEGVRNWYNEARGHPEGARAEAIKADLSPGAVVQIQERGWWASVSWRAGDFDRAQAHLDAWATLWVSGVGHVGQRAQSFGNLGECFRVGHGLG